MAWLSAGIGRHRQRNARKSYENLQNSCENQIKIAKIEVLGGFARPATGMFWPRVLLARAAHPMCVRACRDVVNARICQHAPAWTQRDTETKLDRETGRAGFLPWRGGAACRALPPMFRLSSQRRRGTRDSADKATQTLEGQNKTMGR